VNEWGASEEAGLSERSEFSGFWRGVPFANHSGEHGISGTLGPPTEPGMRDLQVDLPTLPGLKVMFTSSELGAGEVSPVDAGAGTPVRTLPLPPTILTFCRAPCTLSSTKHEQSLCRMLAQGP
jgi:hypothetical protein